MNRDARIELVLCGMFLVGLGLLARHLQPALETAALLTALGAGVLCMVWGAARYRLGAVLTLAAAACVLAFEAVQLWRTSLAAETNAGTAAMLLTVLVVFCGGTLANVMKGGQANGHEGD